MVQSCLLVVINLPRPPKPDQNMLYVSFFHRPLQNSAKFRGNVENSAETGKICGSAQNSVISGKLLSLIIVID